MKPASIKKFDMLWLGSIVVGLIGVVFGWDAMMEQVNQEMAASGLPAEDAEGVAMGAAIFGAGIGIGISLLLWALISLFRIEFVKWIVAIFAALGVIQLVLGFVAGIDTVNAIFGIASTLMGVLAAYFLFNPDATAWFEEKRS